MRKILEIIGIVTLFIGSFMYNEEVLTTAKLSDDLLEEIKSKSSKYKKVPIEAIVRNDTIIPGINGKEVNVKKSYEKMREIGYFNEKLIIYNDIFVKNLLKENKDKYIVSGNKTKKEVALVFNGTKNIQSILEVLNKENSFATFFIDSSYLEENYNYVMNLLKEGHTIGNLSKNGDYSNSDFIWMKMVFTNSGYQKKNYCFTEKRSDVINICKREESYTIMREVLKNPFIDIRRGLTNGGIYVMKANDKTKEELQSIIKYIKSRGFLLKSLEQLLKE